MSKIPNILMHKSTETLNEICNVELKSYRLLKCILLSCILNKNRVIIIFVIAIIPTFDHKIKHFSPFSKMTNFQKLEFNWQTQCLLTMY